MGFYVWQVPPGSSYISKGSISANTQGYIVLLRQQFIYLHTLLCYYTTATYCVRTELPTQSLCVTACPTASGHNVRIT